MAETNEKLIAEIRNYFATGGVFNPEMAIHDNVRDLFARILQYLVAEQGQHRQTEPTPRPWKILQHNGCDLGVGIGRELPEYDAIEWIIPPGLPENQKMANFELVVKCVNTYDELVAALKRHERAVVWLENAQATAQANYASAKLEFDAGLISEEQMEYPRVRLNQAEQMLDRYKALTQAPGVINE